MANRTRSRCRASEEVDRGRMSSVLATYSYPEMRLRLATERNGRPDEPADSVGINRLEGRAVNHALVEVGPSRRPQCRRGRTRAPSASGRWSRTRRSQPRGRGRPLSRTTSAARPSRQRRKSVPLDEPESARHRFDAI